jgi:hypothetical protein
MSSARRVVLLFLVASAAWCQEAATKKQVAEEEDIREAVIRHQMRGWISGSEESLAKAKEANEKAVAKEMNFKIFFVSVNSKDPTDDFIKQLQNIPRTIKKASASETIEWIHAVVDKATGQRGIIFSADAIRWKSKNSVEVEGGYYCDGLYGAGMTFKLRLVNGKWIVKSAGMRWIS